MSITITQRCNGCGEARELKVGYRGQPSSISTAAEYGGWREVRTGEHLCGECIRKAVRGE